MQNKKNGVKRIANNCRIPEPPLLCVLLGSADTGRGCAVHFAWNGKGRCILIKFGSVFAVDKIGIEFLNGLCYNTHTTQDSYIGNTTASQAVKAGSTPVSCSKIKRPPAGWSFGFLSGEGSRTDLNADVRQISVCCHRAAGNTCLSVPNVEKLWFLC